MSHDIKIKINLQKLQEINGVLATFSFEPTNHRKENVERAIMAQVSKKLAKKQIDVFPKKKDFNYKLTYYEADSLENMLRFIVQNDVKGEATYLLRIVADEINQKLA